MQEEHKSSLWDVLWENAIGGIAIMSADGKFIRANPAFCRIVEYSEPELQRMRFQDITAPGDISADQDMSEEVRLGKRQSYDMIKSYITKTNRLVWVHLRVVPFKVADEFHYFISQVFEVPVSIIRQMGIELPESSSYRVERHVAKAKVNWKVIKDWFPLVIAGLLGGAYIIQQLAQHFPIG